MKYKNLLQNHCANFNKTWRKAFFSEEDSSFYKNKKHAILTIFFFKSTLWYNHSFAKMGLLIGTVSHVSDVRPWASSF